ncbi:unnamed protein product [Taenia asiatica]|uniref:Dynein_C domain-containing protein n=1 Tax=Taenia asiatica TaxID=60517 RepID=A0A158R817_TAEAS|nr:unnamed protein product [Taenia asiatica]
MQGVRGRGVLYDLKEDECKVRTIRDVDLRQREVQLDRVWLNVDVTRKTWKKLAESSRDEAFVLVHYVKDTQWEAKTGQLKEAKHKELVFASPILIVKAIHMDKQDVWTVVPRTGEGGCAACEMVSKS